MFEDAVCVVGGCGELEWFDCQGCEDVPWILEVWDIQDEFEISSCEVIFSRAAEDLVVCAALLCAEVVYDGARLEEVLVDLDDVLWCEVVCCEVLYEFVWYFCRCAEVLLELFGYCGVC